MKYSEAHTCTYDRIKRFLLSAILLVGFTFQLTAGDTAYRFRIYLKDKAETTFSVDQPEQYLSDKAIERRQQQEVAVTTEDLPVSPSYMEAIQATGARPIISSKWMNTVVVSCTDTLIAKQLRQLPMVDSVQFVWRGIEDKMFRERSNESRLVPSDDPVKGHYGYARKQTDMVKGDKLHKAGFRGEDMTIAVIDAGFLNVDRIAMFESLKLLGTRNIANPGRSVFEDDEHGTRVLSCLAANVPGMMVGAAPEASYWLIRSEDSSSEYPVEEDYWVAAVEFADSVGVDVISSSLGYFQFDDRSLSYDTLNLDGKTSFISRAAELATKKGLLVISSAGNEAGGSWNKITFPADVDDVLVVGAITNEKKHSSFSSIGFTADNRVKPDVVAIGTSTCVIDAYGNIRNANGTSFAAPTIAGFAACLHQAFPSLSNKEIIRLIRESAHLYKKPDRELGYGIPNMNKAYKKGRKYVAAKKGK